MLFPPKVSRRLPADSPARKYHLGPLLTTVAQVQDCAARGSWIMWRGRPNHPSVLMSQQVGTLVRMLERKSLRLAIRNKLVPMVFTALWLDSTSIERAAWWVTCVEISGWLDAGHISMTSIINLCHAEAKARGHFGPVRVQFEKEMPF